MFAAPPGEPLDLTGLRAAKKAVNTRGPDGEFGKAERANQVVVPAARFVRGLQVDELLKRLFGEQQPSNGIGV